MTLAEQLQAWGAWRSSWECGCAPPCSIRLWLDNPDHRNPEPPPSLLPLTQALADLRQGDGNARAAIEALEVHHLFQGRQPHIRCAALGIGYSTYKARLQWGRVMLAAYLLGAQSPLKLAG